MRYRVLALTAVLGLLMAAPAARAQSPEGWNFYVSPYLWLSGMSGSSTVQSRVHGPVSSDFSASFGDIISNVNFAFMGAFEARNGRFGLLTDVVYMDMSADVDTPADRRHVGGSASTQSLGLGIAALYRVVDDPQFALDIGGGIRPWWMESSVTLNPGTAPGRSASASLSWVDPIIAIRGSVRLTPELSLSAYGDIGGFGAGSKLTWQVLGSVDYRWNEWLTIRAGYRHLAFEFSNSRASLDMAISGPILGTTIRF